MKTMTSDAHAQHQAQVIAAATGAMLHNPEIQSVSVVWLPESRRNQPYGMVDPAMPVHICIVPLPASAPSQRAVTNPLDTLIARNRKDHLHWLHTLMHQTDGVR